MQHNADAVSARPWSRETSSSPRYTTIWYALLQVRKEGAPTNAIALSHQLKSTGDLTRIVAPVCAPDRGGQPLMRPHSHHRA